MAMSKQEREEVISLLFGKTTKEPQKVCCECYERGYKKGSIDGYNERVDEECQTYDEVADDVFRCIHMHLSHMFGDGKDELLLTPSDLHELVDHIHKNIEWYH